MIHFTDMKSVFFKPLSKKTKDVAVAIFAIIIAIGALGSSFFIGYQKGTQRPKNITVEGVIDPTKDNAVDFSTFWQAWEVLKDKYADASAVENNKNFLYGAINGLVNSLKDRNTAYFAPQDAKKFSEDISGQFGGIGAEIGLSEEGQLIIVAPLDDTPASKAGLRPSDAILEIDGESTIELTVEDAVKKIRGKKGTAVVLTISRNGQDPQKISITRDTIQIPTLEFAWLNGQGEEDANGTIAYIKLYNFYEQAPFQFYQASLKTLLGDAHAIIVDVRNNPGGYLDAAVSIAGWFVDEGKMVVKEEFRDESLNESFISRGPAALKDIPTVILVNKGSASASEILAGALKEQNNIPVIGETTFGKGTVQELITLNDGSLLKVTVAHWLTPEGNMIDKNGITPDVEVSEPDALPVSYQNDPVIQKALEVLKKPTTNIQ